MRRGDLLLNLDTRGGRFERIAPALEDENVQRSAKVARALPQACVRRAPAKSFRTEWMARCHDAGGGLSKKAHSPADAQTALRQRVAEPPGATKDTTATQSHANPGRSEARDKLRGARARARGQDGGGAQQREDVDEPILRNCARGGRAPQGEKGRIRGGCGQYRAQGGAGDAAYCTGQRRRQGHPRSDRLAHRSGAAAPLGRQDPRQDRGAYRVGSGHSGQAEH